MLSSFKNFLSRHKRKFIVTGIIVGGTYIVYKYGEKKLRELQEGQANELIEKARRACHYESTEQTCNVTIMNLAPNLCDTVINIGDTNSILEQIKLEPENKYELWDELKVISFSRITALVYSSSLLVITLRVQLNLLGGYLYKDTLAVEKTITDELKQAYLSLSGYYFKTGVFELYKIIDKMVRNILKSYDLKQKLSLSTLEQIFWSIQMAVNLELQNPKTTLSKFMLPDKSNGNDLLQKMFNETLDILESDDVINLSNSNASRGFSEVIDCLADFYTNTDTKFNKNGVIELNGTQLPSTSKTDLNKIYSLNDIEIPIPKLIPILNGVGSKGFSNTSSKPSSLSTSLFNLYLLLDNVKTLGANVYEVFSQ